MKRGVSQITIAVTEWSVPDWPQIRLELYGFRAGIGIKLSHFSVAVFFELLVLVLEIIFTDYIRNV